MKWLSGYFLHIPHNVYTLSTSIKQTSLQQQEHTEPLASASWVLPRVGLASARAAGMVGEVALSSAGQGWCWQPGSSNLHTPNETTGQELILPLLQPWVWSLQLGQGEACGGIGEWWGSFGSKHMHIAGAGEEQQEPGPGMCVPHTWWDTWQVYINLSGATQEIHHAWRETAVLGNMAGAGRDGVRSLAVARAALWQVGLPVYVLGSRQPWGGVTPVPCWADCPLLCRESCRLRAVKKVGHGARSRNSFNFFLSGHHV